MVRKKKSGMVNALIIANAILAVIIGGIIWMLVSKNRAETASGMASSDVSAPVVNEQSQALVSAQDDKKLQALQRQVQIEKQKAQQLQEQERQKAAELTQQLEEEKRRAEAAIAEAKQQAEAQRLKLEAQLAEQKQNATQKLNSDDNQLSELQLALQQAKQEADAARAKLIEEQTQTELAIAKAKEEAKLEAEKLAAMKAEELVAEQKRQAEAEKQAIADKLELERKRLAEIQAAEQKAKQEAAELAKKLETTQTEAQLLAAEKNQLAMQNNEQQESLALQLEQERKRVDDLAANQAKADLENKRLIDQLRAQMQARSQQVASDQASNQQQVNANSGVSNTQQLARAVEAAVSSASQGDQDYIQALRGNVQPFIQTETQRRALDKVGTQEVDYFNRVIVAKNTQQGVEGAITSQVDQLIADQNKQQEEQQLANDQTYLASLDPLAAQRSSESRFITVRRGDTLSNIAARAYNDWRLYTRIFEANPQILSNPNLIYPGQVLRVPL